MGRELLLRVVAGAINKFYGFRISFALLFRYSELKGQRERTLDVIACFRGIRRAVLCVRLFANKLNITMVLVSDKIGFY